MPHGSKLSEEEIEGVKRWLADRNANQPCPSCGNRSWVVGDTLAYAPDYSGSMINVGAGYPAVLVICNNCTFFKWHSAIAMGLVPKVEEEQEDKAGAKEASTRG